MGAAWVRHVMCELAFLVPWSWKGRAIPLPTLWATTGPVKVDSYIACRSHAFPLPCRTTESLECVFPIWFTQCGRVWFTLAMPCPGHAPTMPFFSRPQHNTAVERRPCCAVTLRRTAWTEHGLGMAWQGKCESDTAALYKSNGKDTL